MSKRVRQVRNLQDGVSSIQKSIELGVGNCGEHSNIIFNLLASTTTHQPVFKVDAQGEDHAFVVVGDPRQLSREKLVVVDAWPVFPIVHTADVGAFEIGNILRSAPAHADPKYAIDDFYLIEHALYKSSELSGSEAVKRSRKIAKLDRAVTVLFSAEDKFVGVHYSTEEYESPFHKLPKSYVEERARSYGRFMSY